MYYVGADLHKLTTWFHVLDESGKRVISKSISNKSDKLHDFFDIVPKPFTVAVEATYNWYYFIDIAEKYAAKVYLANSYELKAFAKRHKKTDKIDAKLISEVLRKGYLPTVFIADKEIRMQREILRHRMNTVRDRCRNISRLKGLLDKLGEDSMGDFGTYLRLQTIEIEHLPEGYQHVVEGYIAKIRHLLQEEYRSDKYIVKLAEKDPDVINLMTIPGISWFSGLLIKSEIVDINRFKSFNRLCAYAGLAPRVSQSGSTCRTGSLNTNRRKKLQWILLENAFIFMNVLPEYKEKHERLTQTKGYNKAKVVIARDLLRIIYYVLKEKRSFYTKKELIDVKSGLRRSVRSVGSEVPCSLQAASFRSD